MKQKFSTAIVEASVIVGFAGIMAMGLVGCGDYTGDTSDTTYDYTSEYTYTENNIDYGSGTVLQCDDSNCSVIGGKGTKGGDAVVGEYDENYSPTECRAAGFFFCTIEDKCLNQRVDDASSGCNK